MPFTEGKMDHSEVQKGGQGHRVVSSRVDSESAGGGDQGVRETHSTPAKVTPASLEELRAGAGGKSANPSPHLPLPLQYTLENLPLGLSRNLQGPCKK